MNPTDPMTALGQAEVLAVHLHRPADARAALARARALPLTEDLRTLSGYIDGAIALEEGHASHAVAAFRLAIPALERHARTSPTAQGLLATVNTMYAVALASSGDPVAAARALAAAEPILSRRPRQCGELLERAQRAVQGGALNRAA